jgi:hypothetical protein
MDPLKCQTSTATPAEPGGLSLTLEPAVKKYAQEGTRKPDDVALRLNFDGYKTACGAQWTPRLANILLGFLSKGQNKKDEKRDSIKKGARPVRSGSGSREPLTTEEIAKRRAVLERETSWRNSK